MKVLPKPAYQELADALGDENISEEPAVLDGYAWQPALNLTNQKWIPRPAAVVLPATTEDVQAVVRICNRRQIKFKAHSTGWAAWGGPSEEGELQIDLRRMNRIIELDEKNKFAVVEPYVCCAQLQAEAMKKGLNCHNAIRQAEVAQECKQKYIDQGLFKDDLSDIGWGGIYEGTANWGHCETAAMFDRRDGQAEGRFRYLEDSARTAVEQTLGLGLSNLPPGAWKEYGPQLHNYHLWAARIKKAFDPNSVGDEQWYVPSIDEIERDSSSPDEPD